MKQYIEEFKMKYYPSGRCELYLGSTFLCAWDDEELSREEAVARFEETWEFAEALDTLDTIKGIYSLEQAYKFNEMHRDDRCEFV